jgi:hypothetical protein
MCCLRLLIINVFSTPLGDGTDGDVQVVCCLRLLIINVFSTPLGEEGGHVVGLYCHRGRSLLTRVLVTGEEGGPAVHLLLMCCLRLLIINVFSTPLGEEGGPAVHQRTRHTGVSRSLLPLYLTQYNTGSATVQRRRIAQRVRSLLALY